MNIIDKRYLLATHRQNTYRRRARSDIRNIAIHHSATLSGSAEAFARYHVNVLGWPGIGYHYVINKNGEISTCHDVEIMSYHVGNNNKNAVGICLVGDFRSQLLAQQQNQAAVELTSRLMRELSILVDNVLGHGEFSGYHSKLCPSINMDVFRKQLNSSTDLEIKKSRRVLRYLQPMMRGEDVQIVQRIVGATVDGFFGRETEGKVRLFQSRTGLQIDGIVGSKTWHCLFI